MSIPAKPLTRSEFEALKKRIENNKEAVVDALLVLPLIATVDLHQARLQRCLMGAPVEAWL